MSFNYNNNSSSGNTIFIWVISSSSSMFTSLVLLFHITHHFTESFLQVNYSNPRTTVPSALLSGRARVYSLSSPCVCYDDRLNLTWINVQIRIFRVKKKMNPVTPVESAEYTARRHSLLARPWRELRFLTHQKRLFRWISCKTLICVVSINSHLRHRRYYIWLFKRYFCLFYFSTFFSTFYFVEMIFA